MKLCSDVDISINILSKDKYFSLGLIKLLGVEFIENFFLIIDLDSNDLSGTEWFCFSNNVIGFASNDLSFYKSELFEKIMVLDKRSSLKSILNFFLKNEMSGNYHAKFHLTLREKQMLNMLIRGKSNQEIAEKFGVKLKAIYTYRRNLMNKLGCRNRITFQNFLSQAPLQHYL